MNILFQNKDLVVCTKPAGLLSEAGDGSLPNLLKEQLNCDIFPVHRLDRGTGGVMVFAKSSAAAAKLSATITGGDFSKEYLTVVRGAPKEPQAVLKDLLYHDRRANKSYVVKRSRAGVKEASLEYKTLATVVMGGQELSLLLVRLHTGRTHQIRVQFASRKLPLYGDGKYGGRTEAEGMALWSFSLRFPIANKIMGFSASPPNVFPWTLFDNELLKPKNT